MIESVQILNLKERGDKWRACVAGLYDAGVDPSIVQRQDALCAKTLEKTNMQSLLEGGGIYPQYRANDKLTEMCCDYGLCQMLRRAVRENKTSLIMLDDRRITVSFSELNELVASLPDLKILQLEWYTWKPGDGCYVTPIAHKSRFAYGLVAYGIDACVYTPAGAQWSLDLMDRFRDAKLEQVLRLGADLEGGREQDIGLYTAIAPLSAEMGGHNFWGSDVYPDGDRGDRGV